MSETRKSVNYSGNKVEKVDLVDINSLKYHPKNNNIHPLEQIKRLAKIIEFQGFRVPIIVSKLSGFIVSGHGRIEAGKLLGIKEVPVVYQNFIDENQEYAFLVSENKISEWAIFDEDKFKQDLQGCEIGDFELFGIKNFDFLDDKKENEAKKDEMEYIIILELNNEEEQKNIYDEFLNRGLKCKIMN